MFFRQPFWKKAVKQKGSAAERELVAMFWNTGN